MQNYDYCCKDLIVGQANVPFVRFGYFFAQRKSRSLHVPVSNRLLQRTGVTEYTGNYARERAARIIAATAVDVRSITCTQTALHRALLFCGTRSMERHVLFLQWHAWVSAALQKAFLWSCFITRYTCTCRKVTAVHHSVSIGLKTDTYVICPIMVFLHYYVLSNLHATKIRRNDIPV